MNFTCNECNDTGSRDKLGTYLDCNACGTASMRRDLNDFVKSLGPTHPEDVALAIHQRALAMAPKQEAPKGTLPKWIDDQKGKDPGMDDLIEHMEMIYANYIALASPAAANGALTDERAAFEAWAKDHLGQGYSLGIEEHTYANPVTRWAFVAFKAGRAILAAAGPDTALIDLIQKHWSGAYFQGVTKAEAREINEILALSGAKGN